MRPPPVDTTSAGQDIQQPETASAAAEPQYAKIPLNFTHYAALAFILGAQVIPTEAEVMGSVGGLGGSQSGAFGGQSGSGLGGLGAGLGGLAGGLGSGLGGLSSGLGSGLGGFGSGLGTGLSTGTGFTGPTARRF